MPETTDNVIELTDIRKSFGKVKAVDGLSLSVPAGTVYGFIGPNGSGKTTTIRMIMNIYRPDSGSISVLGNHDLDVSTQNIGYLPEERGLYKKMKVRDVLKFYGELRNGGNVAGEVDHWLERFDLADWANKKVEALSKGMAQKVQFIASVVPRPELLILDEPFTGLDPVNTDVLRNAILGLQEEGTTVIFSTHDMSVAERMCDFILMIYKGKKVLDGSLASIKEEYGRDTLRVRCEGGAKSLDGLDGVEKVNDFGRVQELRIAKDADPQAILAEIMRRTSIESFEISTPSLHDIFVRIAGPEAVNHELP